MRSFERAVESFGMVQIRCNDFVGEAPILVWIATQTAHLELAAGMKRTHYRAALLSVAPITAISLLLPAVMLMIHNHAREHPIRFH